jgi:serine/threonine-protein kinase
VAGIGVLGLIYGTRQGRQAAAGSVAVLPFLNLTGSPDLEFVSQGVTEEITNTLARNRRLRVASRTSSSGFKNKAEDIRDIGRQLGVGAVIEGSIQRVNERFRITARLIRVSDGYSLWSGEYDRKDGPFGVHEEIASVVTQMLGVAPAREQERPPVNPEAWALYHKGRFFWRKWTPEGVRKSIEYFEEAVAKDPEYAIAYAGLADAWGVLGHWGVLPPIEAARNRDAALGRALALNPDSPEVRVPLAMKKAYYEWDWAGAEEEFRRITETDASSGDVHRSFGVVLMARGRFAEAERETFRALSREPLSLSANLAPARLLFYQRRYEPAIRQARKVLEMDAGFHPAHLLVGQSLDRLNRHTEAIESLRQAKMLAPSNSEVAAALAYAHARSGNRAAAEQLLDELQITAKSRRVSLVDFALIHVGLGQNSEALRKLEQACEERDGRLVQLKVNPLYESLYSEPRYHSLLKRLNLHR